MSFVLFVQVLSAFLFGSIGVEDFIEERRRPRWEGRDYTLSLIMAFLVTVYGLAGFLVWSAQ